jgi:ABC-2 type transport system permease protein
MKISRYYWLLRRELWEFPSLYIVPLMAGGVAVVTFAVNAVRGVSMPFPPHAFAAGLVMGSAYIVAIFYALDTLYAERRDRSILFWKSLPVSDTATVLAKLTVPLVISPLITFGVTVVTFAASTPFVHLGVPLLRTSWLVFYHMFTVHALWYAPLFGWLFLISAASKRMPFVWAVLPAFVLIFVERMTLGTSQLGDFLQRHLTISPDAIVVQGTMPIDPHTELTPLTFFSDAGLWLGLLLTTLLVALAVQLRRKAS